jgi:O-antigen/teichoic acid export membrane protein
MENGKKDKSKKTESLVKLLLLIAVGIAVILLIIAAIMRPNILTDPLYWFASIMLGLGVVFFAGLAVFIYRLITNKSK